MEFENKKWRNDVKDFLFKQNTFQVTENCIFDFQLKNETETIKIQTSRPDLIFGTAFILLPLSYEEKYKNKIVLNPFSQEEIPLYFGEVNYPHMGIPAHNEEDYWFAMENNIGIKQVIMPINASLDDNKPRDDKKWVHRRNIVLVIKHWLEDKYLYLDYNNQPWKCLLSGGIEVDETVKQSGLRELAEESGYHNIAKIEELPFKMVNAFYASHKDINRYSIVSALYIELNDGDRLPISLEEEKEHTIKWATKEELFEILKNGFTDQIWLTKIALKELGAYTGNGELINSDFLNGIEDRAEAIALVKKRREN